MSTPGAAADRGGTTPADPYHGRMEPPLSPEEMALWHALKQGSEAVRSRIMADITAATGLSDPDFAVLTRVTEDGGGRIRQNELAAMTGFHRSRLSHQLTRMRERGLITQEPAGGGVEVVVTGHGRDLVRKARPVHAAGVRRHLLAPLRDLDVDALRIALERLAG